MLAVVFSQLSSMPLIKHIEVHSVFAKETSHWGEKQYGTATTSANVEHRQIPPR